MNSIFSLKTISPCIRSFIFWNLFITPSIFIEYLCITRRLKFKKLHNYYFQDVPTLTRVTKIWRQNATWLCYDQMFTGHYGEFSDSPSFPFLKLLDSHDSEIIKIKLGASVDCYFEASKHYQEFKVVSLQIQ